MEEKFIVVVDDNPDMARVLELNLRDDGFRVKGIPDGDSLFKFLKKNEPDLIILDLMLPGKSGFEICKELKKQEKFAAIPIIMLSGKGEEVDKVSGLNLGADDYVVKPFSANELKARIKAVLRRHGKLGEESQITVGETMVIDLKKFEVTVNGQKIELTPTEFKILKCLVSREGQVFTRERILEYLWGEEKVVVDRTVDVHIRHLRKKLGQAADFIKNIRGIGYKLETSEEGDVLE